MLTEHADQETAQDRLRERVLLQLAPPPQPLPQLQLRPRTSPSLSTPSSVLALLALFPSLTCLPQYFGPDASETVTAVKPEFCPECYPYYNQRRR